MQTTPSTEPEAAVCCLETSLRADVDAPRMTTPTPSNSALLTAQNQCQVEEAWSRSQLLGEEHTARGELAQSAMSLSEPGLYICPQPEPAPFYASFLKRKRLELTEKYQHLITRQMLREDRWLEYTVALLQELVEEEASTRDQLIQSSLQDMPRLTLCHMQLQMISAQGTEGTVIYVEEMEREIRFRVMIFDEIDAYEALVALELADRAACVRLENERRAAEADARGCIGAAEWNARWLVEREEEKSWDPLVALAPKDRHRIYEMLLWGVMCREADIRLGMETAWQQSLYPTRSCCEDEHGIEGPAPAASTPATTSPALAALVATHHHLCDEHQEDVRRNRKEREEAQSVAALAFHYARPILADEKAVSTVECPDDDALVLFGHRFTSVPPSRPAGQCPPFIPPQPVVQGTTASPCKRPPHDSDWSLGDHHGVSPSSEEDGARSRANDEGSDDENVLCTAEDVERQAIEVAALWAALGA